jgi:ribosome-associated protein
LARATSGTSSACAPTPPAHTNNARPNDQRIRPHCSTILTGAKDIQAAAPTWLVAVRAAQSKKAADTQVLDLRGITSFADFFVISTGANQRQIQAISDEVGLQLKQQAGELPFSIEGYNQADWVLADYGDLLVHIFSPKAREYYSLERLWRNAKTVEIPPE